MCDREKWPKIIPRVSQILFLEIRLKLAKFREKNQWSHGDAGDTIAKHGSLLRDELPFNDWLFCEN